MRTATAIRRWRRRRRGCRRGTAPARPRRGWMPRDAARTAPAGSARLPPRRPPASPPPPPTAAASPPPPLSACSGSDTWFSWP
uniref:Uncharacterized protein n=1 Tax=Arundo donax TaxID=35708 RepID=A0A0A8XND9_ARUDO